MSCLHVKWLLFVLDYPQGPHTCNITLFWICPKWKFHTQIFFASGIKYQECVLKMLQFTTICAAIGKFWYIKNPNLAASLKAIAPRLSAESIKWFILFYSPEPWHQVRISNYYIIINLDLLVSSIKLFSYMYNG